MHIRILKLIVIFLAFLVRNIVPQTIFHDKFDNSPNWESQESLTETSPGTINWPMEQSLNPPFAWSNYRSARGQLVALGEHTYQVNSKQPLGNVGKSLIVYYEKANNWVGGSINKWLGLPGYDELYLRFYLKYQADWKYRTEKGGVIHKLFRILSSVDINDSSDLNSMYGTPEWRIPDWGEDGGKQAYVILDYTNIAGTVGMGALYYNPEGRAGSLSDLGKNFDDNVRIWWKDYHGKWVAGDYSWSYTNPNGDWQGNGRWVCYEIHVKMNDVESDNFLMEVFINGEKKAQVTGIELRKDEKTKFNYLMFAENMYNCIYNPSDPPPPPEGEQWLAFDNVVISQSYIGPLSVPVGGYGEANTIPSHAVHRSSDSVGSIMINFKVLDEFDHNPITLSHFEYMINGYSWLKPINVDNSSAFSKNWMDNSYFSGKYSIVNGTPQEWSAAPANSFSLNTRHPDMAALNNFSGYVQFRFFVNNGNPTSSNDQVTTEPVIIDNKSPDPPAGLSVNKVHGN